MVDVLRLEGEHLRGFVAGLVGRDVLHAQHVSCIAKNKHESCILALSRHRVIVYNTKNKKLEHNINFVCLKSLTSGSSSTITLTTDRAMVSMECTEIDSFILQMFVLMSLSFPACRLRRFLTYKISPDSREEKVLSRLRDQVEERCDLSILDTFRCGYEALCDLADIQPNPAVIWIIEKVYYPRSQNTFNLQDFDHLPTSQLLAVLGTIAFTGWFKNIHSKSKRLHTDVIQKIFSLCRQYPTINSLTLSGVGQLGDSIDALLGVDLNFTSLDLSDNGLDDKEITLLSNVLYKLPQLQSLNLAGSNFTGKGLKTVTDSLKQACGTSLLQLTLDRCTNVKSESWACFGDMLCHMVSLQELSVSETNISIDTLWTPLLHGCTGQIRKLRFSKCKYTQNRDIISKGSAKVNRFIVTCQELNLLDMSGCKVPSDVIKLILSAISDNIILTDVTVSISNNELGAVGSRQVASLLPSLNNVSTLILRENDLDTELPGLLLALHKNKGVRHLDISSNINKLKSREELINGLISLVNDTYNSIQSLIIADMKLKQDLNPFLGSLAYNKKLVELDISGNGITNTGARILAQSLSVNRALRKLSFDNNQITLAGFKDLAAAFVLNSGVQNLVLPYSDIAACSKSADIISTYINQMTKSVEANNSPNSHYDDDMLLKQQHYILISAENLQLDSAVVNLYDNLTRAQGKKGGDFVKKKKEGLALLKEAEKCYQLMHLLHEKADTQRSKIYSSAAESDIYASTSKAISNTVNDKLSELSGHYYSTVEKMLPNLMDQQNQKSAIQKYCGERCKIREEKVYSTLTKTLQHELTLIIGKCMLQAETKITTLVVESMVSRLNDLAKDVEQLNTAKPAVTIVQEIVPEKEETEQDDQEIDESIKRRRFTYTEKRKDVANEHPVSRSASVSSLNRSKPQIPLKPSKLKSQDSFSADKVPLVAKEETDSTSIKSEEGNEGKEQSPEAKPEIPLKPELTPKQEVIAKPDVIAKPEIVDKPDDEQVKEPEKEDETPAEETPVEETLAEETPVKETLAEDATVEETEGDAKEETIVEEDEPTIKIEDVAVKEAGVTNGVGMSEAQFDFGIIEDTAALTSITKSRVRPRKKARPTKTSAITTLDPFEVASESTRMDSNGSADVRPEHEVAPKPEKKKLFQRGPPMIGPGMNSELMSMFGKKNQKKEQSPPAEEKADSPPPEDSPEAMPKKKPYRPPGGFAMPGMGMGALMGSELKGKLKSRNKSPEADVTDDKSDVTKSPGPLPPKPKHKSSLFSKSDARPRSPGSLGTKNSSEQKKDSDLRTKSLGDKS